MGYSTTSRDVISADTSVATSSDNLLTVLVRRSATGLAQRFVIERTKLMKILDVLTVIQRDHEPSLAFRYSCRVAMCGTCAVRVDGKAVLACQTSVPDFVREVHIAPLAGLPVVRDLVVDMEPFFARWASVQPYLVPHEDVTLPARIPPDSPERKVIDPALDCISCGICYSACAVSQDSRDFVGPAALNRAMVLTADSRDANRLERLDRLGAVDGVDRCHYIGACSECCPKGLNPFEAIVHLRRWRLRGLRQLKS